jgi:glycosyltransferase involved in cell wall biosynthesis
LEQFKKNKVRLFFTINYLRAVSKKIIVFGPGPQFKGGIANFTVSLAKALQKQDAEVTIVSWSQQYPAIIPRDFIDRNSKVDLLEGTNIEVKYICNYNSPFSWYKTVQLIEKIQPEIIVFQWAIAIQGLPMGWITKRLKKILPDTEIIYDVHNVVQKETGALDKMLTRYALKGANTYIMHGQVTIDEFSDFLPELSFEIKTDHSRSLNKKTIFKLYHPVYDLFEPKTGFDIAEEKKKLGLKKTVFLFFGFIRKYKGLHYAIEAFSKIAKQYPDTSLLIVGESFWNTVDKKNPFIRVKTWLFRLLKSVFIQSKDQEKDYNPLALIKELGLEQQVAVVNRFIANEEVHRYFQVSDAVVNYYEYATPSGIESIAYNFNKPILATSVGHFAHAIVDGENGYLAKAADVNSMAATLERFIKNPVPEENVKKIAAQLSWENYAATIIGR